MQVAKSARSWEITGYHTMQFRDWSALRDAKDTRWDHALEVTAGGEGLVGHAGAVLLRKLADQCGLTAALDAALGRKGRFPQLDRGNGPGLDGGRDRAGRHRMSDIAVLAQLAPVLGAAPCGSTVRRDLDLADRPDAGPDRPGPGDGPGARLGADRGQPAGFPWLDVAGKVLAGLAGHRHGRHAGHRPLGQGREHLPPGRWAMASTRSGPGRRIPREMPGHAAAHRQRRLEHLHRPQRGAGRRAPAGPRRVPAARSWSASTAPAPATSSSSTCCP